MLISQRGVRDSPKRLGPEFDRLLLRNSHQGRTAPITLTLSNNPGTGTLGGTRTINTVNGVATFTDLFVNKAD